MAAPNSFSLTVCVLMAIIQSFLLINLSTWKRLPGNVSFHLHWKISCFGICGKRESLNCKVTKWMDYNCSVPAICLQSTKKGLSYKVCKSKNQKAIKQKEKKKRIWTKIYCSNALWLSLQDSVYTTQWLSWSKKASQLLLSTFQLFL